MSPKKISPNGKKQKSTNHNSFPKPKKNNNKYLMEQMCDFIRSLDKKVLQTGIRVWTPFTKGQGVLLQEGNGYIIKNDGVKDEHDIFIKGGELEPYDAIAKAMSKHYEKEHLEIIKKYLELKPITTTLSKTKKGDGKFAIEEFDKVIKKQWPKPPDGLKGKTKEEIERARKAINYFSAILAFGEPYRRQGSMAQSLDLINKLIKYYISPNTTPIKSFLCKDGENQHPITMKGASENERTTKYDQSETVKKKRKIHTPESSMESDADDSPHSSDNDNIYIEITEPRKKKIEKKEMKEERNISSNDSSDSYSGSGVMKMSVDSESEKEEVKEIKEIKVKPIIKKMSTESESDEE